MKTAFLFPGQGAQSVGMGKDIYEKYDEAKKIYKKVEEITVKDIKKICFDGSEAELIRTENAQLAILTTSLAILEILKARGIKADIAVGLSLGEYTALIYGGYISVEDGIKLIQKRGYYMENYLPEGEYAMAAVIGLNPKKIEEICAEISLKGKFVVPANYNCTTQTAISGTNEAIDIAIERLKEAGAKRVIKLKTSGPFHTQKLEEASRLFYKELEKIEFHEGKEIKVIKNLDGKMYSQEDELKEILAKHIISPVRFDKAIDVMREYGVDRFIEIGPGKTLTGFVKKDYPEAKLLNINNCESLEKFLSDEVMI